MSFFLFFRAHMSSHSLCSAYQWHFGRASVKNVTCKIIFLVAFVTSFYFCEKKHVYGVLKSQNSA